MSSTPTIHYSRVAIALHWLIAALIIGQLAGGKIMMALEPNSLKFELFQLHKSFGFIILFLSCLRLIWRFTHKAPALPDDMSSFEKFAAKLSHLGFYILMLGIPLSGWVLVSASMTKITTKIFKTIKVPDLPFVQRSESFEGLMKTAHEYMAYAMMALLILHIGAALKHHFISQDDVLLRMLPRRKTKDVVK